MGELRKLVQDAVNELVAIGKKRLTNDFATIERIGAIVSDAVAAG